MYTYLATLARVIDGDTVDVVVDLGFSLRQTMRLRLAGINTPEVRGAKREAGLKAKAFVIAELRKAKTIGVKTYKIGKYGRYVADIYYANETMDSARLFEDGTCLNQRLLRKRLATRYPD